MAHDFNFTEGGYVPGNLNFDFSPPPTSYSVLKGTSNNFVAIWADLDAGLNNGKMYIGSFGDFQVVKLDDQTIYDWYSTTRVGRGNESLDANDIVDTNVTGGV